MSLDGEKMELVEINNMANEMLKDFVNCLGLDGEYYVSVTKTPIMFENMNPDGMFLVASSSDLKEFLDGINIDDKRKKNILDEGLIVINKKFKYFSTNREKRDLFISLIHEKIHSNRIILLNSQFSADEKIDGVFYDDKRFVQNTDSNKAYYADSYQDIFHGSLDDSNKTIKKYSVISNKEKKSILSNNHEYKNKMEFQRKIDEALVEVMAIATYYLYLKKTTNILQAIKDIRINVDGDDIRAITNIILRHNDLELFKWMIDPLSYQVDDVNYDFFGHYITNEDLNDLNIIFESEELTFDNYFPGNNSRTRNK